MPMAARDIHGGSVGMREITREVDLIPRILLN
jgi:hypothetical protein